MMPPPLRCFFGVVLAVIVTAGCDSKITERSDPIDTSRLLADRPSGEASISEVVRSASAEAQTSPTEVTLIGRIDAGGFEPFESDEASFLLSELPDPAHASDDPDHADHCPFCKRRAANATKAVVQFRGEDGQTLPTDARKLLGVEKGDVVIVRGLARFDPALNLVTLEADKLWIDRTFRKR